MTTNSKDLDVPEDWEVHEEETPVEKTKPKSDSKISNNILWVLFILIFIAFALIPIILPFFTDPQSQELQSTFVDGIKISAQGDPVIALQNLANAHIEGKRLDDTVHSHDAINEIFVVFGQSQGSTSQEYTLLVGITGKTEISIIDGVIRIEGTNKNEFWKAVWTFNSIVSQTEIDSSIDLYNIQNILSGRKRVYLVEDTERQCSSYGNIVSAQGDFMSSLGYKQAQYGYDLVQYQKSGDECTIPLNETPVDCPTPSETDYVITMARGDSNKITIEENEMLFEYARCDTVARISVIPRDLLHPTIVSDLSTIDVPIIG